MVIETTFYVGLALKNVITHDMFIIKISKIILKETINKMICHTTALQRNRPESVAITLSLMLVREMNTIGLTTGHASKGKDCLEWVGETTPEWVEQVFDPGGGNVGDLQCKFAAADQEVSFQEGVWSAGVQTPFPCKIKLPKIKDCVLIGKAGETIRNLQNNSGVKIPSATDADAIPNSYRSVALIGTLENRKKAEQLVKDVITEANAGGSPALVAKDFGAAQSGSELLEMQVLNEKVGLIIGKGGETFKTKSGARIQLIPQHLPEGDLSKERMVRVTGNKKQIEDAKDLIKEIMNQADAGGSPAHVAKGCGAAQSGSDLLEMQVPKEKVGLISGKGYTIKTLQTKSGVHIQLIPQHLPEGDQSKERMVRVTGNKKQLQDAKKLIKEVMNLMTAKSRTTEVIALTEKKMDMTLDDIIKMSRITSAKEERPLRPLIKNLGFLNGCFSQHNTTVHFMDSKSSIRQRPIFCGNQFRVTADVARMAVLRLIHNRVVKWYKQRGARSLVQRKAADTGLARKDKMVVSMQRPQTLVDSLQMSCSR